MVGFLLEQNTLGIRTIQSRSMCVTIDGSLDWILHLLTTILGTTNNYNTIANLHSSLITTAPAKSFPVYCVSTSPSLATASYILQLRAFKSSLNGGSLPTPSFLHRLPYRTDLVAAILLKAPLHGTSR
jgi:hypothetical protein